MNFTEEHLNDIAKMVTELNKIFAGHSHFEIVAAVSLAMFCSGAVLTLGEVVKALTPTTPTDFPPGSPFVN